jgi:hypothetical protein
MISKKSNQIDLSTYIVKKGKNKLEIINYDSKIYNVENLCNFCFLKLNFNSFWMRRFFDELEQNILNDVNIFDF